MGQFTQGVLYRQFLVSYNLCTIYLHVIEVCLKVTIAVFYFCHSKNSLNVMNNTLNPISIYSWKKIEKKYKKQMCYKENKSQFLTLWRMDTFFLQKFVVSNMITDSFLVEKWGTERARRHVSKNLLNLDCQDRIRFGIYHL